MELYKKIDEYCLSAGISQLISERQHVIVGFSGGADSTVLISYFADLQKRVGGLCVIGAHVNHMIRGAEADRDEEFCKDLCQKNGIPFECLRADVPAIAKEEGKTLEEAARDVRYTFFRDLCEKYPHSIVATAHNADDNLETVIFNLTRGSGTKGLSGISPVRDGIYIRPLLSLSSEEIRSFARDAGISYMTDSTNSDTLYTRNAIRHKVIPVLRQINPKVHTAALRLSTAAREDCDYIESSAKDFLESTPKRDAMRALHPSVLQRVLRLMYRKKAGSTLDLSEKNVSDCKRLLESDEGGHISLPRSLSFYADKYSVRIDVDPRKKEKSEARIPTIPVAVGEKVKYGDFYIICTEVTDYVNISEENIYNLSLHASIDCDRIYGKLFVRHRIPGDKIFMGRMNKKLKKLFCDKSVPVRLRNTLPVIEDEEGVLWVPMLGLRDECRATDKTQRVIELFVYERNKV